MRNLLLTIALVLGLALPAAAEEAEAIFAGGCFWCMEPPFDKLEGVTSTVSGYTGGRTQNPTYKQVTRGGTGHFEAVRVTYDPDVVSYETLLKVFWRNVDPFDDGGQFCDRGDSYRTAVFYTSESQARAARDSKQALEELARFDKTFVTPIVAAGKFYPAEDYHQDYYVKNPLRYKYYRWGCGRDDRLKEVWGDIKMGSE